MKVCLFEGRHELPENEGALYKSFNFNTWKGIIADKELFEKAVLCATNCYNNNEWLQLYVTGLTPALTDFIKTVYRNAELWYERVIVNLTLLHFNRETGKYWEQRI